MNGAWMERIRERKEKADRELYENAEAYRKMVAEYEEDRNKKMSMIESLLLPVKRVYQEYESSEYPRITIRNRPPRLSLEMDNGRKLMFTLYLTDSGYACQVDKEYLVKCCEGKTHKTTDELTYPWTEDHIKEVIMRFLDDYESSRKRERENEFGFHKGLLKEFEYISR